MRREKRQDVGFIFRGNKMDRNFRDPRKDLESQANMILGLASVAKYGCLDEEPWQPEPAASAGSLMPNLLLGLFLATRSLGGWYILTSLLVCQLLKESGGKK